MDPGVGMKVRIVIIARLLALLWAGFWTIFFIAEAWAWKSSAGAAAFWAGGGLFFLVLALVPWGWERGGGVLLALVGLAVGIAYPFWAPSRLALASRIVTALTLSVPPLVAGMVFLLRRRAAAAHT